MFHVEYFLILTWVHPEERLQFNAACYFGSGRATGWVRLSTYVLLLQRVVVNV
jgi:hypothetical protein